MSEKKTKIALAMPLFDNILSKEVISFTNFYQSARKKYDIVPIFAVKHSPATAKNFLVKKFKETDCDYLLFLDQNTAIDFSVLEALLKHEKDIVSANETHPVSCMLISRKAIDKLGEDILFKIEKNDKKEILEEDKYFYSKLKEAKLEIVVEPQSKT